MKKKIAITGKTSRVAKTLKKYFFGPNITYLDKKKFDLIVDRGALTHNEPKKITQTFEIFKKIVSKDRGNS